MSTPPQVLPICWECWPGVSSSTDMHHAARALGAVDTQAWGMHIVRIIALYLANVCTDLQVVNSSNSALEVVLT